MKLLLLSLALFSSLCWSMETEFSGNIEAQARRSWNNEEAKKELFQRWDEENFYLLYGNLNGKVEFDDSRLESNLFVRHSTSVLYRNDYLATQIFLFPQRLVARDLFKLKYLEEGDNSRTESVINKLYYQWNHDGNRYMLGRMYINYGQGEIFNPINPFNQPTGLTSISSIAQGNDGLLVQYYQNEKHVMNFYFLGDKRIENYSGRISQTLWLQGEVQATEALQLDYVLGDDQKRYKFGGQISYQFSEAMLFTQLLYQTGINEDVPTHNLWDAVMGYDQQLNSKWHLRLEGGYQKQNRYLNLDTFGERFLPTEYFIALANQYEVHPLVKLSGTVINDIKSGFTYFIARSSFSLGSNLEADLFGFTPVSQGDQADNAAQKLVTRDIGLSLRAFF